MQEIECPHCIFRFTVVWSNDGGDPPEFCPRCGIEIGNYNEHIVQ